MATETIVVASNSPLRRLQLWVLIQCLLATCVVSSTLQPWLGGSDQQRVDHDDSASTPSMRLLKKGKVQSDLDDCDFPDSRDDEDDRYDGPPPCRISDDDDLQSTNTTWTRPRRPPNQLEISFWVGNTPQKVAITPLVASVVTNQWDIMLDNMHFSIPPSYSGVYKNETIWKIEQAFGNHQGGSPLEGDAGGDGGGGQRRDSEKASNERRDIDRNGRNLRGRNLRDASDRRLSDRSNRDGRKYYPEFSSGKESQRSVQEEGSEDESQISLEDRAKVFDMYFVNSESKVIQKYELRWWWMFKIKFECFWKDDESGVGPGIMVAIEQNMTSALERKRDFIQEILQSVKSDDAIRIRTVSEGVPDPKTDNEDVGPSVSSGNPIDPQEWDWRKYLGLSLLVFTLASVAVLRFLGARRQREREQRHVWGNLASKEGVDALLNTAWVLEGSKMQIYDKTKMGYSDDNSLFLGGYEQREAMVGAEITVTHQTTEIPDTVPSDLPGTSFLSSKKGGSG
ncbi:hypothetical protein ACA910_022171 [Epithemia clementina (nom. ined.)]